MIFTTEDGSKWQQTVLRREQTMLGHKSLMYILLIQRKFEVLLD